MIVMEEYRAGNTMDSKSVAMEIVIVKKEGDILQRLKSEQQE